MITPVLESMLEEYPSRTSPLLLTSQRKMVKLFVIFQLGAGQSLQQSVIVVKRIKRKRSPLGIRKA